MPSKFPKPFYRTARNAWFLQVGGKQIKLGPDRDAAFRRYHELMGQPEAPAPRRRLRERRRRARRLPRLVPEAQGRSHLRLVPRLPRVLRPDAAAAASLSPG